MLSAKEAHEWRRNSFCLVYFFQLLKDCTRRSHQGDGRIQRYTHYAVSMLRAFKAHFEVRPVIDPEKDWEGLKYESPEIGTPFF